MSASLVGSEMCIRDRGCSARDGAKQPWAARRSGCETTRRGRGSGRPTRWSGPGPWASGSTPRTSG
eukprot:11962750-Alexandrium_andersonii.AAC.1